jgi:outer membrane translocation and assembly module TamA
VPRARERAEVCEAARGVGARAAGRADAAAVGPPDPAGRHGRRLLLDEAAGREARRRAHAHARHTLSRAQVEGAKQEAENEKVKLAERIAQLSSETQEADRKKQQLLDALQRAQKELLKAQHTQLEYGHKVRETQELQTRCAAIETELMHAEVQKENEMALRARLETEVETLKEEKRVMASDVQRMQRRQR